MEDSQSDLAALWNEALDAYSERAKVPIKEVLRSQMSITTIMMDQQQQLQNFGGFRHNKGKVDKLRGVIAKNADIIQSVAKHVSNAASAAFPPSSAILTAFTYVMNASKHVSEDYDVIEGFFDIMSSFLQRLSLLEHKLPAQKAYQGFLMRVFASLLTLSGIARAYCLKGRFMKWAKALVDGADGELKGAMSGLNENLQRLESATIIQTLRVTIEAHEEAKSAATGVKALQASARQLQDSIDHTSAVAEATLDKTGEVHGVVVDINVGVREVIEHTREAAGATQEMLRFVRQQERDSKRQKQNLQSGASKPANLERLKTNLGNPAESTMGDRIREFELVNPNMFNWLAKDQAFEDIVDGVVPGGALWVSGAPGMGKSNVAFKFQQQLHERLDGELGTCVTCFFFDSEDQTLNSLVSMLKWAAIKAAEGDARYCEELVTLTQRNKESIDEAKDAWESLVVERFPKESSRRLVLVLDGVDDLPEEELTLFVSWLQQAAKDELRIQVVFTSDPKIESTLGTVAEKRIALTTERIADDLHELAKFRSRELPRLRKLRRRFRHKMAKQVAKKADTLLYVEHTVRRFNSLRREGLIVKELDNLPENTTKLYETLLNECKKNRSPEELEVLRNLFAWLAYAKGELTLGDATKLIGIIAKENSISLEEELDGRSSRLLRISGSRDDIADGNMDDDDTDAEPADAKNTSDDGSGDNNDDDQDVDNVLSFQERSLRAYFRAAIDDTESLRCSPFEAQTIIFKIIAAILTMPKEGRPQQLVWYAASQWVTHLMAMKPEEADPKQAAELLESLHGVLSNRNDALRSIERFAADQGTVFAVDGSKQADVLAALEAWSRRALSLPPNALPYGLADFYRPLASEPRRVFINLARAHIHNWFNAPDRWDAFCSFVCAHSALYEGRNLPELRQNPTLRQYFADLDKENEAKKGAGTDEEVKDDASKISTILRTATERSFEVVANAFWDIVKTTASYRGIGMAMKQASLFEAAIPQFDEGLSLLEGTPEHWERFATLYSKSQCLFVLGHPTPYERDRSDATDEDDAEKTKRLAEEDPEKKKAKQQKYLEDSVKASQEAIAIFDGALTESGQAAKDDARSDMSYILQGHAQALSLLGDFEGSLAAVSRTMDLKLNAFMHWQTVPLIAKAFMDGGQPERVMELLKVIRENDRKWFAMIGEQEEVEPVFRAAAKVEGGGDYVINMFRTSARDIIRTRWGGPQDRARMLQDAAVFSRRVLGNVEASRDILREVIADPHTPQSDVSGAVNRLSEILLEDFLRSSNPLVKAAALDEARQLRAKLADVLVDFDPWESDTAVLLAVMLRRLGPAMEHADVLKKAFDNCMADLKDDTYANDIWSMRRLSRVLMCVEGMERDAEIAYTAQNYILDDEMHRRETSASESSSEDGDETKGGDAEVGGKEEELKNAAGIEVPSPDVNGVDGEAIKRPLTPVPTSPAPTPADSATRAAAPTPSATATSETPAAAPATSTEPEAPKNEMDEGLLPLSGSVTCDYCSKALGAWSTQGPAYYCLYCINIDICEDCMKQKRARDSGEMEADWRVICPKGHRHVRGPIEGWRGVKGGKLRIGDEEIPVQTWLRELELKWSKYWKNYWTEKLEG